jgi:alpha/beta superfamily hydrolase
MERKIQFQSKDLLIEGLYKEGSQNRGAVITHPHPLYGGEMHNTVVTAITEVYQQMAFSTLRFNFRGVGGSSGQYEEGIGTPVWRSLKVPITSTQVISIP